MLFAATLSAKKSALKEMWRHLNRDMVLAGLNAFTSFLNFFAVNR